MKLNEIRDNEGAHNRFKRLGRGSGSGKGKTSGKGVKGQKARTGHHGMFGFEGGQMPLQRRLPKGGFTSLTGHLNAEVRLHELAKVGAEVIDLDALKAAGVVAATARGAKIILSGALAGPVSVRGVGVTKGARAAIEAAGGKVLED